MSKSNIRFNINDTYPNLKGTLYWDGPVTTNEMSVSLISNGNDSGQFAGPAENLGGVSDDQTMSSLEWSFDVTQKDTVKLGAFILCMSVGHPDGDIETVDLECTIGVSECG